MGLTEQQKRWNESIEETWKNRNKKNVIYNKNINSNSTILGLYEKLKEKILQVDYTGINIVEKSNYISFKVKKNNQNFVDVQLQKSAIKCVINLKNGKINGKSQLRDISKIGHFGSGDYEGIIKNLQDITYCMDFIVKSFRENS